MRRRMPHRVTVQTLTTSKDSYGTITETWADERDAWAEVQPLSGNELRLAGRVVPMATHTIRLHWDPALPITTAKRIVRGTTVYNIHYVENVAERDRWVRVYCDTQPA